MKPSEKAILDVLRKSTLAYLTDVEFAGIEKAVERDGILNLTGLSKSVLVEAVEKHGNHDQSSHGAWANGKYNPDDSEGEDESESKNYKDAIPKMHPHKDDSEEEYEELDADDPKWMDNMDIMRPSRITASQRLPK